MRPQLEDFDGDALDASRWLPYYLPHWSSRSASRADLEIADSMARLRIASSHPLWCPDDHEPPLRVSAIASGLFAGEVGSTIGQQPFRDGQRVREAQPVHRGWLLERGRLEMRVRARLSMRSMASVWLTGFEDAPERSGEVCVFEVFGDTIDPEAGTIGVGAGLHRFRDPALAEDFTVTTVAADLADWHRFAVEIRDDGCSWWIDDVPLRTSTQAPRYPLQIFVGVFDFPDPESGGSIEHEPALDVDWIRWTPLEPG